MNLLFLDCILGFVGVMYRNVGNVYIKKGMVVMYKCI